MTMDLGAPEKGCLLLADITGYTEYMGETELMHAQDVIADLLETIVDSVEPMFQR
jgi:class 3 adenylate cyclase